MKKLILIFAVCALNFVFFQNFTSITEDEKSSWGSKISETDDNTYDDFKSALDASNKSLNGASNTWNDDLEELDPEDDSQEVGVVIEGDEETPL